MKFRIEYAYTSHIGKRRANHEDNFWCDGNFLPRVNNGTEGVRCGTADGKKLPAFAVFDGMGGESCGEIASGIAAETFDAFYNEHKNELAADPAAFSAALNQEMNRAVCAYAAENMVGSMGSTSAFLLFGRDWYVVSNLGDSRIYTIEDGKLRMLTIDHVFRGGFYRKPPLVQFLGLEEDEAVLEPFFRQYKITDGQIFLLCSDGVSDMLTEEELLGLLSEKGPPQETVGNILEQALRAGGRDNITAIAARVVFESRKGPAGWFDRMRGRE